MSQKMKNRDMMIENCKKYLDRPYVWGGESMEEGGYDCSGLVYRVLQDCGFQVGRTTSQGYRKLGRKIPAEQKQKGDLLFFGSGVKATHMSIYDKNEKMYESIGGSSNTKENPGPGVTYSSTSRRKDLIEVRTLFDEDGRPDASLNPGSSGGGSGESDSGASAGKPDYQVGNTYTLQAEMKVRTGAGTNYRAKSHKELTPNGQNHDADKDGAIDTGTRVTCQEVKRVGNDIWIRTPSGWIAGVYQGKTYIK